MPIVDGERVTWDYVNAEALRGLVQWLDWLWKNGKLGD